MIQPKPKTVKAIDQITKDNIANTQKEKEKQKAYLSKDLVKKAAEVSEHVGHTFDVMVIAGVDKLTVLGKQERFAMVPKLAGVFGSLGMFVQVLFPCYC